MKLLKKFNGQHQDLIHDVSYNVYGNRLSTCSSDQTIKIWDRQEGDGQQQQEWTLTCSWKAHSGSVWKTVWAHPEYGQGILASCSFDRTVAIWEEVELGRPFEKRATLVDARDAVRDIAFGPRHLGLRLATCAGDGVIRVYEASDIVSLAHWPLMEEFEAQKGGANCIAWNECQFDPPMMAVGSDDGRVKIWLYNDSTRKWAHVASLSKHRAAVHDVAWAPNLGRSYHLLATASKDQTVRIWRLETVAAAAESAAGNSSSSVVRSSTGSSDSNAWTAKELHSFDDHKAEVWRVAWNVTGTTLASSGDDGAVRLWQSNVHGVWSCFSVNGS